MKHTAALVVAVLLFPAVASAQNSVAYRLGPGAQMTCSSGTPTHISTRGTVYCKSTDSNRLHYTDPSGADITIGSGGGVSVPLIIPDAASPLGVPLLKVTDNGGTNTYFSVSAASAGAAVLDFIDGASASLSATGHGTLIYNNSTHVFQASLNGGAYAALGGGASWPLTNGTSTNTLKYAGTMTGSSIAESHDTTNAYTTGDIAYQNKSAGTVDWFIGYPASATIPEFRGAGNNIGFRNVNGDGLVMQAANHVYIYGAGSQMIDFVANNGIETVSGFPLHIGTVAAPFQYSAFNWNATPLGTALTSASTITPVTAFHHVTGTVSISTIATTNLPTSFGGTLTLICDATCVFATGGNISVGFTGSANSSYDFAWDGTAWRPQGLAAGNFTASNAGALDLAAAGAMSIGASVATSLQIGKAGVQTKINGAYALATQAATMTATTSVTTTSNAVVKLTYASTVNVTSMTLTAPGIDGQVLTVMLIQPAAGTAATMTTTWTNVNFAGTASFTATLGKRDIYSFVFDSSTSKWYETARALNQSN